MHAQPILRTEKSRNKLYYAHFLKSSPSFYTWEKCIRSKQRGGGKITSEGFAYDIFSPLGEKYTLDRFFFFKYIPLLYIDFINSRFHFTGFHFRRFIKFLFCTSERLLQQTCLEFANEDGHTFYKPTTKLKNMCFPKKQFQFLRPAHLIESSTMFISSRTNSIFRALGETGAS